MGQQPLFRVSVYILHFRSTQRTEFIKFAFYRFIQDRFKLRSFYVLHRQSAKKHARADAKKRTRNRHRKATLRTSLKAAELALQEGDVEKAQQLCKTTTSLLDRAASKGVIKKRHCGSPEIAHHAQIKRAYCIIILA